MMKDSEFEALRLAMVSLKKIAASGDEAAAQETAASLDQIDALLEKRPEASYDCE